MAYEEMYECNAWLFETDYERLERLMERTGYSRSAVVREALKAYEEKLAVENKEVE